MDKFTKRDGSGAVDLAASAKAYTDALSAWVAENEVDAAILGDAVNAVLDRFPGQTLPMPALVSLAVTELGATPQEFKALSTRVHAHIRGMASLKIAKGVGGGVSRK